METIDWEREHLKDVMYLGERKFEEEQRVLLTRIPAKIIVQKQKIEQYDSKLDTLAF